MKMNEIKYLPKSNAFADVYSKATGVPFIGEMMAAAAGNGSEPKEQFQLTVKVVKLGEDSFEIDVTSNMPAPVENASIYITDFPWLDGCEGDYSNAFEGHFVPSSEDPTVWWSEDYWVTQGEVEDECGFTFIATADWFDGSVTDPTDGTVYEHTISGTWTYEDQTENEKTLCYVAYSDDQGTHETSRGTGIQTGLVDSDTGKQELLILTNNNYPELVGQNAWVSEDAAVDDGELWKMDMPLGTPSGLYLGFFSEEPEAPKQDVR